jgi:hypothetical protein
MSPDRIELSGDIPARSPKRETDVVVTEISGLDTKLPILSLDLIASRFQNGFQWRVPWTTSNRRQRETRRFQRVSLRSVPGSNR